MWVSKFWITQYTKNTSKEELDLTKFLKRGFFPFYFFYFSLKLFEENQKRENVFSYELYLSYLTEREMKNYMKERQTLTASPLTGSQSVLKTQLPAGTWNGKQGWWLTLLVIYFKRDLDAWLYFKIFHSQYTYIIWTGAYPPTYLHCIAYDIGFPSTQKFE